VCTPFAELHYMTNPNNTATSPAMDFPAFGVFSNTAAPVAAGLVLLPVEAAVGGGVVGTGTPVGQCQ